MYEVYLRNIDTDDMWKIGEHELYGEAIKIGRRNKKRHYEMIIYYQGRELFREISA